MTSAAQSVENAYDYMSYEGYCGEPLVSSPLELDSIRRFVHGTMDGNRAYFDATFAAHTRAGVITAPPLYPVHAFRRGPGDPDPLDAMRDDPDSDGTAGMPAMTYGLPRIPHPFKKLLNGGSDVEFYRCMHLGERAVAKAKYKSITKKQGRSGEMLIIVREVTFETDTGDLLIIVRQTSIWR